MGDQFSDILSDADVTAGAQEASVEKPQETQTQVTDVVVPETGSKPTEVVEPQEPKDTEDFDRAESFRKAMSAFEGHIPEADRKAFKNRIEQAERHFNAGRESKELKARLGEVATLAKSLASMYEGGEDYLAEHGPTKFLQQWNRQYGPGVSQPADPVAAKPVEHDDDTEDDRIARIIREQVEQLTAPTVKELASLREERERDAQAKKFASEFNPIVESVVAKWGLSDDKKAAVGEAFADVVQNLYMADVISNQDNPDAVTITATAAKAEALVEAILSARAAKKKAPPKPEVVQLGEPTAKKDAAYSDDLTDLADELFKGVDESLQKG